MDGLFDVAIYIMNEANRRQCNPMEMGTKVTRKLRLRSTDAETLFMGIWLAQKFNLDEPEIIDQIKQDLSGKPEFDVIKHI